MVKQTKTPGKAIVKWDEELANLAKEAVGEVKLSSAKFLSFKGGMMSYAGAAIPDNELEVVILAYTLENQYYDSAYDPSQSQVPACYAFGLVADGMVPHEEAPDKQNSECVSCPHNQWGSAKQGEGKACANVIRIEFIPVNDLEDIESAEIIHAKISRSSTKNFLYYISEDVKKKLRRPFWSVITKITLKKDQDTQFKINFKVDSLVEDGSLLQPLKDMWEKHTKEIDFPYPAPQEKPVKAKPKASKFTKRK